MRLRINLISPSYPVSTSQASRAIARSPRSAGDCGSPWPIRAGVGAFQPDRVQRLRDLTWSPLPRQRPHQHLELPVRKYGGLVALPVSTPCSAQWPARPGEVSSTRSLAVRLLGLRSLIVTGPPVVMVSAQGGAGPGWRPEKFRTRRPSVDGGPSRHPVRARSRPWPDRPRVAR